MDAAFDNHVFNKTDPRTFIPRPHRPIEIRIEGKALVKKAKLVKCSGADDGSPRQVPLLRFRRHHVAGPLFVRQFGAQEAHQLAHDHVERRIRWEMLHAGEDGVRCQQIIGIQMQ